MRKRLTTVMVLLGIWLWGMLTMPVATHGAEEVVRTLPALYTLVGMGVVGIFLMLLKSVIDGFGKKLYQDWSATPCDKCPDHTAMKNGRHKLEAEVGNHDVYLRWLGDAVKKIATKLDIHDLNPEPKLPIPRVLTEFPSDLEP